MHYTLHDYQQSGESRLWQAFKGGARGVLCCMATGGGKTVLACSLIERAADDEGGVGLKTITMATLCSGIGAPEMAALGLPIIPIWCAEIEPFPSAVLAARFPESPNLGDMTAPDFSERAIKLGIPDLLVAGTPCQDFSISGLRAGIEGARGNLTVRFLDIIDELRPLWVLYENVPGLLSLRDGETLCYILDKLNGSGYVIDGNILDAQHFGVAQRRRRIFLTCHHLESGLKKNLPISGSIGIRILMELLRDILGVHLELFKVSEPGLGASCTDREANQTSRKRKTGLSSQIMKKSVILKSVKNLEEKRNQLGNEEQDFGSSNMNAVDGLRKRMHLLGLPPEMLQVKNITQEFSARLLKNLDDCLLRFREGQNQSASLLETLNPGKPLTITEGHASWLMESESINIKSSWSNMLAALYAVASAYTMSMETSQIIESKIYSCAETTLSIATFICNLRMSPENLFDAESSSLTTLKEYINYARQAMDDLFTKDERRDVWTDYYRRARVIISSLERRSLSWPNSSQVLPVSKGVRRDHPPRRSAQEDLTGTLAARTRGGGGLGTDFEIGGACDLAKTLREQPNMAQREDLDTYVVE